MVIPYIDNKVETLAGIHGELGGRFRLFISNRGVRAAFSKPAAECITHKDLENGYDIYYNVPLELMELYQPISRIFFYLLLLGLKTRPNYVCDPVLGVLDEVGNLGEIPGLAQTISTIGGKMVSLMLLWQDNSQGDLVFGEKVADVVRANCAYKVVHQVSDTKTREYIQDLIGKTFRIKRTKTRSYSAENDQQTGYSESETLEECWVYRAEEIGQLKRSLAITKNGHYAVRGVPYYEDKRFD